MKALKESDAEGYEAALEAADKVNNEVVALLSDLPGGRTIKTNSEAEAAGEDMPNQRETFSIRIAIRRSWSKKLAEPIL